MPAIPKDGHMHFGKHDGKPFSQVPVAYFQWLIAQDFIEKWINQKCATAQQLAYKSLAEWLQDHHETIAEGIHPDPPRLGT